MNTLFPAWFLNMLDTVPKNSPHRELVQMNGVPKLPTLLL